jgi:glycosyltransferase involved in cell wall biosynthesis
VRIHLHDGSGHPFQVQLSRALARRGHEVLHTHATQWVSGHGHLTVTPQDPPTLRIEGITAPREYDKYSPLKRSLWELSYARAWQAKLAENPCDVVLSCNTQLFVAAAMRRYFTRTSQRWVLWHQDIYSLALRAEAARKLPGPIAKPVGARLVGMEQAVVRGADEVIAIGPQFPEQYREWGMSNVPVTVIPNWAPLDEITPGERDNGWWAGQGLPADGLRLLYAGTLGRKHNPQLLLDLVEQVRTAGGDAVLVVASEGPGADYLAPLSQSRDYVTVLPFQPAELLSPMLASGDVLIALLEPDAGKFSVPSKVLSYLSAGRPVLGLVPDENPASADIAAAGGFAAAPTSDGVATAARWVAGLAADPARVSGVGMKAREYAQIRFDIEKIADDFERVLRRVAGV